MRALVKLPTKAAAAASTLNFFIVSDFDLFFNCLQGS